MDALPSSDRAPQAKGSMGWHVGLLVVLGAVAITIGAVLATPSGGAPSIPYVRVATPSAVSLPGGRGDAPPHLRPLPTLRRAAADASGPPVTTDFPHLP